jgi:hypothetical protein
VNHSRTSQTKVKPNPAAAGNGAKALPFHIGRHARTVPDPHRSAGAGVGSVVAVDFRNRMADGVLKQQC